jgi:hypothetical protein
MEKNKIDELSRLFEQLMSGEITQEEFKASKNNLLNPSIDSTPENETIYPNNNNLGVLGGNTAAPLDMNNLSALLENRANEERKSNPTEGAHPPRQTHTHACPHPRPRTHAVHTLP